MPQFCIPQKKKNKVAESLYSLLMPCCNYIYMIQLQFKMLVFQHLMDYRHTVDNTIIFYNSQIKGMIHSTTLSLLSTVTRNRHINTNYWLPNKRYTNKTITCNYWSTLVLLRVACSLSTPLTYNLVRFLTTVCWASYR